MKKQAPLKSASRIRQGDIVRVLTGKDKGKTGQVMAVFPRSGRVLVEKINIVKKHIRPKHAEEKGQRVSVAAPIDSSNVQLVCPSCKKSTRLSVKLEADIKQRICRHCHEVIK